MTSPTGTPYVITKSLLLALDGHEGQVLDHLGIPWRSGQPHIPCPYPAHADGKPSWRWDANSKKAFCTCSAGDSILDITMKVAALDFDAAKMRAAAAISRTDLIQNGAARPKSDAASLLAPPAAMRDDGLVSAYLGFRLNLPAKDVFLPATAAVGWKNLAYFDAPAAANLPPERVGDWPCAVFEQIGINDKTHAHRNYLAANGQGKAQLGNKADGTPRDAKKSAKVLNKDRTAGRCVWWGDYKNAARVIIAEGIETAAALAQAHRAETESGKLAVAAGIAAGGLEQFQPWPPCRVLLIAGDRDENSKPDGRAGSRRGEQAAVKLAGRLASSHRVSILLPGVAGETIDWLDVFCRDGAEVIRSLFRDPPAWQKPTGGRSVRAMAQAAALPEEHHPGVSSRKRRFRLDDSGVSRLVEREDPNTGELRESWQWFCSPLSVLAATRDDRGEEWGRLLEITDRDGIRKNWAMPMAMLAGDGAALRERLLSLGLELAPGRFSKESLAEYIATTRPDRKARCVERVGWHGRRFVLPDATFSAPGEADEEVILQSRAPLDHAFRIGGDLGIWREQLARLAAGNSRLVFALSAAFAAPLLELLELEGGGFHFRGASSVGKSTALLVAGSVWGGGGLRGYVRSWRATDNAMESVAATHCDALLCLDELAQIAPEAAGATAYMLTAGAGKQRAGRGGEARAAAEWRTMFLSTGEISLADKMSEDGRGRRQMAGQGVRVIDLPADAAVGLGLFEALHNHPNAAEFAQHLKAIAATHYGVAGRAFLSSLVEDLDEAIQAVKQTLAGFVKGCLPNAADGQVARAAQRFGLVAAAGELAVSYGILPWDFGSACDAAERCFTDWLEARGGSASGEEIEGVRAVRRFLELHGTTRFERLHKPDIEGDVHPSGERANSRVGYREQREDGTHYFVLPESWKEICGGYDPKMVARSLVFFGALNPSPDGKFQVRKRLPIGNSRCYHLSPKLFETTPDE